MGLYYHDPRHPPVRSITPIELGLIVTLIGVAVVTALPLFFPWLLG